MLLKMHFYDTCNAAAHGKVTGKEMMLSAPGKKIVCNLLAHLVPQLWDSLWPLSCSVCLRGTCAVPFKWQSDHLSAAMKKGALLYFLSLVCQKIYQG